MPDENEPELISPEHLLIENVVRDPRVKFFGIPKLGSYLALPITYGSWLQPGGAGCSGRKNIFSSGVSGVCRRAYSYPYQGWQGSVDAQGGLAG